MKRICLVLIALVVLAPQVLAQAENELRVTPELEAAARRGLEFLARTQNSDGSWPGNYGQGSGVVGLAMLSFLAYGETPDEGRYGKNIRRAVEYIVSTQEPNGLLCGKEKQSPMYNHGFATLALAEVYGRIDYPPLGPALKKAVGLIVTAQNRLGGWRYSVNSQDADTTVSGAQMMALRAAAGAGIEVPYEVIQRGVKYYASCFVPGGGFGYHGKDSSNMARAGIGLTVLSLSGEYASPMAKATADWMVRHLNDAADDRLPYMCYYASQAMYQAGPTYWRRWNEVMTPRIISLQREDGSWPATMNGGGYLETAFMLLAIEINYNLLPIYQR